MSKYIKVEGCLDCPKIKTCKEWKKLTPQQRFSMKVGFGTIFVLRNCPLPTLEEGSE